MATLKFDDVGLPCYAKTADDAWNVWFQRLVGQAGAGSCATSRDGVVVGEYLNAVTVINDPTRNIVKSPDRNLPMRYAVGELLWYLSGSNRVKDISQFSKVWERLSDDGETVNSAYGYRIFGKFGFNQFQFVYDELDKNPNSRRAVIHIKDPVNYQEHPSKDVPCTVCLQYLIRDRKLHATTYMRSNDIWMGFPYDVFSFTCFQILLAMELGVEVGTYTHIAGSLHLYKRDYCTWLDKLGK
jgi:thymidylate synthase